MARSSAIRIAALRRTFLGSFNPPEVPEDLSPLSDEELTQLADAIRQAFEAARPEARSPEAVAELSRMADALDRVRAEVQRRADAGANQLSPEEAQRQADELARRVAGGDPDPELAALAALSEEERQALAANSAEEWAAFRYLTAQAPEPASLVPMDLGAIGRALGQELAPVIERLAAQPRRPGLTPFRQIQQGDQGGGDQGGAELQPIRPDTTIVAGADIPNFGTGQPLEDLSQVYEALVERRSMFDRTPEGVQEKHLVARFRQAALPEERNLLPGSERENTAKVNAVMGLEEGPLVASGGLCAPVEPYYDIQVLANADRQLRGAFPTYNAARGGIRLIPPPHLSDAAASAGFITMAVDQAALGGTQAQITAATKPCLHVACGSPVEYDVAAITSCLEFGNFTVRAFPEQMPAWLALSAANQAMLAEQKILDALSAVHTQVAEVNAESLSAGSQWLAQVAKYGTYLRNHHRMDPMATLRLLAPHWVLSLFQADFLFRRWDDPTQVLIAQAEIEGFLRDLNVQVTFYVDSGTGKGQLMNNGVVLGTGGPPPTSGPLHFPANVVWHLFPEGSWLRLDSGNLDLGIVRDSSLNSLNNFRIFSETFEAMAFVGLEGLEVSSPLVATGLTAGVAYGSSTAGGTGNVAIPTTY